MLKIYAGAERKSGTSILMIKKYYKAMSIQHQLLH